MSSQFLLLLVLIPAAVAFVNMFLPTILRKILTLLCSIYLLYMMVDAFFISKVLDSLAVNLGTFNLFGHTVFAVDQMALFTLAFIQLLSFLILIFSLKGVDKRIQKSFFILFPLTVAGCNGVILSDHAFSFIIFWGLSGMILLLFALLGRTKDTPKSAFKTIMIIGGSDALLIMGFVLLFVLKPASNWSLAHLGITLSDGMTSLAFLLLAIAAFAKAGGFPFHTWVPDFAKNAPVESAALLPASLDKLLGIYLLARMFTSYFNVNLVMRLVVVTLGAVTVITAVMMAMTQHNGRRLLGYHAVSQVGYMIMGVGSGNPLAFAGGLFHMINNTIYKSNLFLTLGSVEKQTGTNELDDLGGLGRNMPITFFMALIGALSISGIPPFNGFFSKWMIYQGVLEMAKNVAPGFQMWILLCLILAVFGSALTLASFMKFLHAIYLGKRPDKYKNVEEAPANQWLTTGALALLCLVFGIFAVTVPLKKFIFPAMQGSGLEIPAFTGLYQPIVLFSLFLITFVLGMIIYLITKNVRFDEIYLGGMPALEKFRVTGTTFYNEIRNMSGLRGIYNAAENHLFDAYDVSKKISLKLAGLLQKAHPGLLPLYVLFIAVGVIIFLAVL